MFHSLNRPVILLCAIKFFWSFASSVSGINIMRTPPRLLGDEPRCGALSMQIYFHLNLRFPGVLPLMRSNTYISFRSDMLRTSPTALSTLTTTKTRSMLSGRSATRGHNVRLPFFVLCKDSN